MEAQKSALHKLTRKHHAKVSNLKGIMGIKTKVANVIFLRDWNVVRLGHIRVSVWRFDLLLWHLMSQFRHHIRKNTCNVGRNSYIHFIIWHQKILNIKQQKVSGNILIIASVTTWMSTLRKLTSFLILFYYYYLQFTYNNRWMWFNTNSKTSSFWAEKSCRPLLNMLSQPVTKLLSIDTILS